jgi:trimethylamine:corrinoid methyltransferase-like protein
MGEHAFDITNGTWRITGDYEGEGNVAFYHAGELHRRVTVPGYKIWNIAAHASDIVADFEEGMAEACSDGLGGSSGYKVEAPDA